jgi:hypothetical protein
MRKTVQQIAKSLSAQLKLTDTFHEDLEPGEVAWLLNELLALDDKWRSVFGHLGATPDDCGNVIYAKFGEYESTIDRLKLEIVDMERDRDNR